MADQLVERVVPADVFARGDQLARRGEARRRVQPAGLVEHALVRGEPLGQRPHDARRDARARADRRAAHLDLVERGLAADPARGAREVAARAQVVGHRPPEPHGHDVVLLLGPFAGRRRVGGEAVRDRLDVVGRLDDPFGAAEPDRELEVVAGRAHRDRERDRLPPGPLHADLHRLLGRELVATRRRDTAVDRHAPARP